MIKDKRGQMGIDFIVGISIFMLALLFFVSVISGMFLPFQTETIDLNSVSYRTSVILVEDAGYWNDGTNDGEDWENNIDSTKRIGLAIDKMHPNELELNKLTIFRDETEISDKELSNKLGLYRIIGDSKVYYGFNIVLTSLGGEVLMSRGDEIPEYGDVSSMKRIVNTQTDSAYLLTTLKGDLPLPNNKARFSVTKKDEDITIIVGDLIVDTEPNNPKMEHIKILNKSPSLLEKGIDYKVWIDNSTGNFEFLDTPMQLPPYPYNSTSLMKITIYKDAFIDGVNEIEVKFTGIKIIEEGCVNLDELEKTIISEPAILKVNIWN